MTNEELVTLIQSDGVENKSQYLQELYEKNSGLIRQTVRPYLFGGLEEDDLMQQAFFGLYEAAKRYESEGENKFTTYLTWWVKSEVGRYAKKNGSSKRLPEYLLKLIRDYKTFISEYEKKYRIVPTDSTICRELDISQSKLDHIRQCIFTEQCVSMDTPVKDGDGITVGDQVRDQGDMETEIIERLDAERDASVLWRIVDTLEEKQSGVINCYYRKNNTVRDISQEMDMTESRVRAIKEDALKLLKKKREVKLIAESRGIGYENVNLYSGNGTGGFRNTGSSKVERVVFQKLGYDINRKSMDDEMNSLLAKYKKR